MSAPHRASGNAAWFGEEDLRLHGHVAGFFIHALRLLAKHASGQYITGNSVDTSLGALLSFIPQYRSRGSCNGAAVWWGCAAAVDLGFAVVGPDVGPSRRVRTGANAANDAVAGMMSSDRWR